MTEQKHTPGPWEWNDRGDLVTVKKTWDEFMEDRYATKIVQTDGGRYPPFGPDRALIAAAPDLYEALDGMLQVYGGKYDNDGLPKNAVELELIDMARAAIAKATGEQS